MKLWQWFLAHGDKLLAGTSAALLALVQAGAIPGTGNVVAAVTGILAVIHTVFFPEPAPIVQSGTNTTGSGGASKAAGFVRLWMLAALATGALASLPLVACKTLPTGAQQAGIAAAVDIAAGLAIQQGSTDPAVWKVRATQFEAAARSLLAVNAAGPTSLQTIMADIQPFVAKLGPADVLAANALVAALTPIVQQQLGANPTLANTQQEISLILQDVIAACSAYTGS